MSKLYKEKLQCTGCHGCANICPVQAVTMKSDDEGFLYPIIDEEKCIGCHLCEQVCPIHKSSCASEKTPNAFAAVCTYENIRMGSSSGGVFPVLAEYILKKNGAVFGAVSTEDCKSVEHQVAFNIDENTAQRGSKYLQSRIGSTYKQAEELLKSGKMVLFTGTPCQIAGLYAYLRKNYENLYTQDLICHGVPSPLVWKKYLDEMEKKARKSIKSVSFRNKGRGWKNYSLRVEFSNRSIYCKSLIEDPYLKGFMSDLFLRPSCYECRYKSIGRQADITLADFWGVEKVFPELDDDCGVSLIYVHSQKGKELLDAVRNDFVLKPVDANLGAQYNPAMIKSSRCPERRRDFMADLHNFSYKRLSRKYLQPSVFEKLSLMACRVLRGVLRRIKGYLKK